VGIRKAELVDLNACLHLDAAYLTDHVWQMDASETGDTLTVNFRTVRLPRPMKVSYPREPDSLLEDWRKDECFLVADHDDETIGYVDVTVQNWNRTAWVNNLVVAKPYRRQGVGSALLRTARRWAQEYELLKMVAETQTKNYPAISFYQKNAYRFCGYNDRYYLNQDIALFFVLNLR
jgi:ribosomal protein S18 acetylase RimI-like enzyme